MGKGIGTLAVSMVSVVSVVAGQGAQAAVRADPDGTVAVNQVPLLMPRITVLGASSAGVLYGVERPPYDSGRNQWTYLKPTGKPAYQVSNDFQFLVGDRAYAHYSPRDRARYLIVGSTVERRCHGVPQPASQYREANFAAYTSFGWLSDSGQRVAADATGCRVIGDAPGIGNYNLTASDDKGYVLGTEDESGLMTLEYRSYADPTRPRPIQTGGRNRHITGLDLAGDVITWAQTEPAGGSYVVRSLTTGGAAMVTRLDGFFVGTTAINGGMTGWAGCEYSDCHAGTIGVGNLPGPHSIASDGSRFLVDTYGSSPGVDTMRVVASGQPRVRVATVGLVPPETFLVAVGASTVTYVDNQLGMTGSQQRYSLHRRSFTKSGSTLRLGLQKSLGEVGVPPRVARDGRRTAYTDAEGDLWIVTDDGVRTRVFDAATKVAIVRVDYLRPFRLSGHRMLWVKANYSGDMCDAACYPTYNDLRLMLYDVRTGRNADLGVLHWDTVATVWGSYLAYTDGANRILRKDLSSGAVVQVKGPGPRVVGLDVNGTIVGWSTCNGDDHFGNCATSKIGYRIMTTSSVIERVSRHTEGIRLTGGYLVHETQQTPNDPHLLKVWRLGTSTVATIGQLGAPFVDAHDETVAWYGLDRIAKLAPLAPFTARPRYLGNAIGSASFTPNGDGRNDLWAPEFPISKALPSCRITITSGTTPRRSLPCTTALGAARVVWNGRDSAGRLLPTGRYTWTLTGSDADGTLLWWTGSAKPVRGTVTITSQVKLSPTLVVRRTTAPPPAK